MIPLTIAIVVAGSQAQDDDYLERLRQLQQHVALEERAAQEACLARQGEAAEAWSIVEPLYQSGRPEGLEALGEFVDRYLSPLAVDGVPVDCPVESLSLARAYMGSTNFLSVRSEPSGATVLVDGLNMGRTPFVSNRLPEGKHMVRVELDGYRATTQLVEVEPGAILELHDLVLVRETAPASQE
jgi:hypothetical protein